MHTALKEFRDTLAGALPQEELAQLVVRRQEKLKHAGEAGQLDRETRDIALREIYILEDYRQRLVREEIPASETMDAVRNWFGVEVEKRQESGTETGRQFDNAFHFLEQTFGQEQELVLFVTEITAGYDTSWFVENFGCDAYFRHNKDLLFDSTRRRIREEIHAARSAEREENRI